MLLPLGELRGDTRTVCNYRKSCC